MVDGGEHDERAFEAWLRDAAIVKPPVPTAPPPPPPPKPAGPVRPLLQMLGLHACQSDKQISTGSGGLAVSHCPLKSPWPCVREEASAQGSCLHGYSIIAMYMRLA